MWTLFLGRVLQAIAGSGAWVIGLPLLTDNVPEEHLGEALGIAMSFVSAGVLSGPLVAGIMLELTDYWSTWSIPFMILALDVIARLVMIEPRGRERSSSSEHSPIQAKPGSDPERAVGAVETTSLLPQSDTSKHQTSGHGFYRIMLCDMRVIAGLASMLLNSMLMTSMNNTLPVHLREIFGWGSMPTGLIFLCLQLPSILCGGLFGCIRDRCGLKIPSTVGWLLCAIFILFLGIPGHEKFPWAGKDTSGQSIFIGCIVAFGISSLLVRGTGPVQLTCNTRRSHDMLCSIRLWY